MGPVKSPSIPHLQLMDHLFRNNDKEFTMSIYITKNKRQQVVIVLLMQVEQFDYNPGHPASKDKYINENLQLHALDPTLY